MTSEKAPLVRWIASVSLALVACHPAYTCEDLGNCATETRDAQTNNPSNSQHVDASVADANATESGGSSVDGSEHKDADVHATGSSSGDGHSDSDAGGSCSGNACGVDAHVPERCALGANNPCGGDTPVCMVVDARTTCVQCIAAEDCALNPAGAVCVNNVCHVCDPATNDGCTTGAPWCVLADGETPQCAVCALDEHCIEAGSGNVCVAGECATCDVATHRGCGAEAPYCVALDALGDSNMGATGATDVTSGGASSTDVNSTVVAAQCVECRTESDCGNGDHACVDGACVECTTNEHCTEPTASVCDSSRNECTGCSAVGECNHLPATPACNVAAGTCVECTREESAACVDDQGTQFLCVTVPTEAQFSCSDRRGGTARACYPCVNDAECAAGDKCVAEVFKGEATGQHVCMQPVADAGDCRAPFNVTLGATSEGGVQGSFCRPALTTCEGQLDFRGACESDDSCGLPNIDDGRCIDSGSRKDCTYECTTDSDCNLGATCTLTVENDSGGETRVCSVAI